ncbi:hypothetical protein EI94DRAFT_1662986 [Lactarius quietus]|nr:hypothetical protein EI94DRAFT_1662986 [Lactarius quietus]
MVSHLPSPVLTLASHALDHLDTPDALPGLWTVFTKCKESLQDGRRLENISWRLWYRELAADTHTHTQRHYPTPPDEPLPHYPLTPVSEKGSDKRPGSRPGSPTSCLSSPTGFRPSFSAGTGPPTPLSIPPLQSPPTGRRPRSCSQRKPCSVGKIICDMIPDKLDFASAKPPSVLVKPDPVIVAADPGAMLVAPIPCMLLPPSTPPTAVGPRVVVVNPTPHPTPPATPVLAAAAPPAPSNAQHLAPPPRLSAAVTRQRTPDATIPSNPTLAVTPSISSPPQIPAQVLVAIATQVATPQPQDQPQLLRPRPQAEPQPPRPMEDTLKLSDRRFFLQQEQSPSPERDVQDGSISTGKSPSETGEVQPSSVTSNQTRASAASASSHPTGRGRRTRNAPARPTLTRLNSGRHVVQVTRKELAKARTAAPHAKVDKAAAPKLAGSSRPQRSPVEPQPPPAKVQAQHMNGATIVAPKEVASNPPDGTRPGGAPRRGIVVTNSSSEFETTDTDDDDDDDSWASEDISEGGAETAGMRPTDKRPPTKEEIKLREAAVEAQRQRELFVKQPKRSYSNLGRTQSGLLSQLLNPDPTVLPPPGRPYRVSSTHDVTRPGIPSALTSGKSSAAIPQAAQITAQAPMGAASSSGPSSRKVNGSGPLYRPKGRPQGEELEDESDSPDDPDDTIQVSHSLAQQRLAALANPAARRRASDNQVQPQAPGMGARPLLPTVATAPIPLNHPWNLPAPAPPTTPRTTRRQMLSTELSESLRRNLLWERQVSKTNLLGNAGRRNGGGGGTGGGGGLRAASNGNAQAGPSQHHPQQQQRQQQQQPHRQGGSAGAVEGAPTAAVDDNVVAERRKRALARNRTWDDFHYFGW